MKITKDMTIQQTIQADRRLASVFMEHGMFCVGCPVGASETIEQAAAGHNVELEVLLDALNEMLEE
ncbi:MAG: DUF1858 domain-containing protein [Clostridia bacterium]